MALRIKTYFWGDVIVLRCAGRLEISAARFLWRPHVYDLLMLDVRRYSPAEALEFNTEVMHRSPHEHFVFLLGPPKYLSRTWPDEVTVDDVSRGQWGETVKRFLNAA